MSSGPNAATIADTAGKQSILVVEDDRDTRELIRLWLDHGSYEVVDAASAEDALGQISDRGFDLAMVDVMLPGLDGFRLAPRLAPIPVLLMSVTDIEDVPGEVSVAGFLSKPFSRAGLERAVRESLAPG